MTTTKKILFAIIGIIALAVVWWLASPLLPAGRPNPSASPLQASQPQPTIGPPQSLPILTQ